MDRSYQGDRDRWNARYRQGGDDDRLLPVLVGRDLHRFPRSGRAIDVGGGAGQVAVVLAARGLDVTVADVSDVALGLATARADRSGVTIRPLEIDLVAGPFPAGLWDVITCFDYLDRALFPPMARALAPGGILATSIATRSNLERHERPSARYLLDDGELPSLLSDDLEIVVYREGWNLDGRHTADLIARRHAGS